ncbi:hypothetical protein GBA52_003993 [Prunus armeniaca]|nr:hypothetical protein GBA52_003993 [Prunus armeniaca]
MEAMDNIVQGFTKNLAILEAKAFKIVGVEELSSLQADHFLVVGGFLTAKPFHKEALFGPMKNIWRTQKDVTAVPLDAPARFFFSFKYDLDHRRVLRSSP